MSRSCLRTVVADTSALVSLAVPRADGDNITTAPDPLQYLLTACEVSAPPEVVSELHDISSTKISTVLLPRTFSRLKTTLQSKIRMHGRLLPSQDQHSALTTAKQMESFLQMHSMSKSFSPMNSVGRIFYSCCSSGTTDRTHTAVDP